MNSYEATQADRDREYREAYASWVGSLEPEERRELERLGVAEPSIPGRAGGCLSGDAADSPAARCEAQEVEEAEPETDDRLHHVLRRMVGELLHDSNPRLSLECLALVTGLAYLGDSMTEIAKRHGVTRAAVSKRCVALTLTLGLPPSRAMRSLAARDAYRQARTNNLT
jgi:hypothetical protein